MHPLDLVRTCTGLVLFLAASLGGLPSDAFAADSRPVIELWPAGAPGSEGKDGADSKEAVRVTDAGEHIVSNVHRPSVTVYTLTTILMSADSAG